MINYRQRIENVKKYDAYYRQQQRSMQNTELVEFENKKAKYSLYDRNANEVTGFGDNYTILWYDARMKNYVNLLKELPKKRIATTRIVPVLVVDKLEHMTKVYALDEEATNLKIQPTRAVPGTVEAPRVDDIAKHKREMKKAYDIKVLRRKHLFIASS